MSKKEDTKCIFTWILDKANSHMVTEFTVCFDMGMYYLAKGTGNSGVMEIFCLVRGKDYTDLSICVNGLNCMLKIGKKKNIYIFFKAYTVWEFNKKEIISSISLIQSHFQ